MDSLRSKFASMNNSCQIDAQLSMGPFYVTRDPTQPISWLTQPNPLQVEESAPNPTQPKATNKFNCLVQPNLI